MKDIELLNESISKIGKFLRFGSKPGLERVSELLRRLGNPQLNQRVIHVAGTNGKGSVCRCVYSALMEAGYKPGLFVSPYIEEFTERIEYYGKHIPAEALKRNTDRVIAVAETMIADGLESPTEFEIITAVMFCYYQEVKPDVIILEVGLGGRGDSTNVIVKPLATCITSISYDHMNVLGNTLEEIAAEKAGIIKDGVPVIYASRDEDVCRVIEEAARSHNAPVYNVFDFELEVDSRSGKGSGSESFSAEVFGRRYGDIVTGMPGKHQIYNSLCAIAVLDRAGFNISEEIIKRGISKAKQPGRIEVIDIQDCNSTVVLDGSHNEDSVKALSSWALSNFEKEDKILVVTGILADKEREKIASLLADFGTSFIITRPDNPRALDPAEYSAVIKKYAGNDSVAAIVEKPTEAADYAFKLINNSQNHEYKGLIFTGSLYMISEVRNYLLK